MMWTEKENYTKTLRIDRANVFKCKIPAEKFILWEKNCITCHYAMNGMPLPGPVLSIRRT
jgi:hypothetical protein